MTLNTGDNLDMGGWLLLAVCVVSTLLAWTGTTWSELAPVMGLLAIGVLVLPARMRLESPERGAWVLLLLPVWGVFQLFLGSSVYAQATLRGVTYWAAVAVAVAGSATLFRDRDSRHLLLRTLGILASVLAWMAILQPYVGRLGIGVLSSAAPDAYAATFANRNMYACFAEIALPGVVWLATRDTKTSWFWLCNATAIVGSVLISGSRAGGVFILLETFILAGICLHRRWRSSTMLVGGAVAGVVVLAAIGEGGFVTRLQYEDPLVLRRDIYRSAVEIIGANPLTGAGLGTFVAAYPAFAHFDNARLVDLAHNDWLQLAVECGLPAAVLWTIFAGLLLIRLRGQMWAMGLPVVLAHALVDFPFHRIGVAAWWMLLAGAVWSTRPRNRRQRSAVGRWSLAGFKLPSTRAGPKPAPEPIAQSGQSSAKAGR